MPKSVTAFKQAFKQSAEARNKKIRWGTTTKTFRSQTHLASVVTALDTLEGAVSVTNVDAVRNALNALPKDRKTKYKTAIDALEKDLDEMVVQSEQSIDTPVVINKVQTGNKLFGFQSGTGEMIAENLSESRVKFVHNVMGGLKKLTQDMGVAIDGMDDLLKSIIKDPKMGATSDALDGSIWGEAIKRVEDHVLPAITKDLKGMKDAGLLPPGAVLKGLKFTGSDFHKGGKQVLILRFDDKGTEKKVVYKPSSLEVDALLFGKDSVADKLGGVSTYNIVPARTDDKPPKDAGYGYMEFVDTEGGPTSATDVMGIYKSIAAAMAMSYYVGLEDVHHENVVMKKGAVQVIDMEATTGTFIMPTGSDDLKKVQGGFIDQQWAKAINDGFKKKLQEAIANKKLAALPKDGDIEKAMVDEFSRVAGRMSDDALKTDLKALETELAKQRTRLVPIPTDAFQGGIIQMAQAPTYKIADVDQPASLANWVKLVDENLVKENNGTKTFLSNAKGITSTPLATVRNLLVTAGVYKALVRGDVPYYSRELGSSLVYDEENNAIAVPGMKKVGRNIAEEMAARRTAPVDEVVKLFKGQGVRLIRQMNTELEGWLPKPDKV